MNERIRELIVQAQIDGDSIHYYNPAFAEKLVHLVVLECASICEIEGRSYEYSFTPAKAKLAESTANHCSKMIQKHFGIEE